MLLCWKRTCQVWWGKSEIMMTNIDRYDYIKIENVYFYKLSLLS